MFKNFRLILPILALASVASLSAKEEELFYNFEDGAKGVIYPDGWEQEGNSGGSFKIETGAYFAFTPVSGNYLFGGMYTGGDWQNIYIKPIKVKGGTPVNLEFYFMQSNHSNPESMSGTNITVTAGKSKADADQKYQLMTTGMKKYTSFTKFNGSFTPDEDGEYIIRFNVVRGSTTVSLALAFDDITIEYTSPDEAEPETPTITAAETEWNITASPGQTYRKSIAVTTAKLDSPLSITAGPTSSELTAQLNPGDADGLYTLDLALTTTEAKAGSDAVTLGAEGAEPVTINVNWSPISAVVYTSLRQFYDNRESLRDDVNYMYSGSAIVTYVDNDTWFLQDKTAAVPFKATGFSAKEGDILASFVCNAANSEQTVTLTGIDGQLPVVSSSDNTVTPNTVDYATWAASPANYINQLIKFKGVSFKGVEEGDVFDESDYTIANEGGTSATLRPYADSDLIDSAIPAGDLQIVGISRLTDDGNPMISPRRADDITEIIIVVHNTEPLPYLQMFDNVDDDYDGTSWLPRGWTSTGDIPFITASIGNFKGVPSNPGEYYMVGQYTATTAARDQRAYTPWFDLEAGVPYSVSFYYHIYDGYYGNITPACDLALTVGNDQSIAGQFNTLFSISNTLESQWQRVSLTFTPEESGQYCFSFVVTSDDGFTAYIGIDDFCILAPGQKLRPVPAFDFDGLYDIFTSDLVAYGNHPVKLMNATLYGEEYHWDMPGCDPSESDEVNPEVSFPASGEYTITLSAKNESATRESSLTFNVNRVAETSDMGLVSYNPEMIGTLYRSYSELPVFNSNEWDFATGFNQHYCVFAERYTLPEDVEADITSISYWMSCYGRRSEYTPDLRNQPFNICFYGETDGMPDENKCFGRINSDLVTQLGTVGTQLGNHRSFTFDQDENGNVIPIKVKGTFYVSYEFDESTPVIQYDQNIVRSYFAMGAVKHKTLNTTLFCKVRSKAYLEVYKDQELVSDVVFQGENGKWYRLDEYEPTFQGLGTLNTVWAKVSGDLSNVVALGQDSNVAFAAAFFGDSLQVSGTEAGETVRVFDAAGRLVAAATADGQSVSIPATGLESGIYVVAAKAGSAKVMK